MLRTAASTCVESVTLFSSLLQQSEHLGAFQQGVKQDQLQLAFNQASAKLAQHRVVEASVGQFQTERILPVNPAPHRIRGLAVRQAFHKLQHGCKADPQGSSGNSIVRSWEVLSSVIQPRALFGFINQRSL